MPRRKVPDPFAEKVGARVRALRKERGMSITKFAEASGVSKGQISTIERGLVVIKIQTVVALARGLDVAPGQLVTFPEDSALDAAIELLYRLPEEERRAVVAKIRRG
jgi:transcriptional regulator with XRE-family HTH domain